jgi:hypothetical protein
MKNQKLAVIIPLTVLLLVMPLVGSGCEGETAPPAPAVTELAKTMVPNLPLDVYLYVKQEQPTRLSADTFGLPVDMEVVSLAFWGVAQEDEVGFGAGLTLSSARQAKDIYQQVSSGLEGWSKLSGNTIYFVYGSGTAARSLRKAIEADDFKPYDDADGLEAAAALPATGGKVAALALVKPSEQLIGALAGDVDEDGRKLINLALKLIRLKVIAAGVYAPGQVDVAGLMAQAEAYGVSSDRDLGILAMVQSGLPGFMVKPAVEKLLDEQDFSPTETGEYKLYRRPWATGDGGTTHVIIRVEGSKVFIAVSGRESYAEKLISSVE